MSEKAALADQVNGPITAALLGVSRPQVGPSIRTKTSKPKPIALSSTPNTSVPCSLCSVVVCGASFQMPKRTNRPRCTLTQKIQRQPR